MTEPRIVPPEKLSRSLPPDYAGLYRHASDLAYTAAVLGEQREAVLALHRGATYESPAGLTICETCDDVYPCPTARTLGVTA